MRKRLIEMESSLEVKKTATTVKQEPLETSSPLLASMISTAPNPPPTSPHALNYLTLLAAFRQFLHGYIQAGGDENLANTLGNYVAALPMPPNSLNPIGPLNAPKSPFKQQQKFHSIIKAVKREPVSEPAQNAGSGDSSVTLSSALGEDAVPQNRGSCTSMKPVPRFVMLPVVAAQSASPSASGPTSEIQQLREAAFGRYKNVLCVICNEWICSRNRKNHIEAHLNYRPYKCSACSYARRREIFVDQHIRTQHKGVEGVVMLSDVDLHVAMEVDRLAEECVTRTRKIIDTMQEKKDGDFGENKDFDEKALQMMLAEEAENKVVVIESVSQVRPKVANYHRRQRTKVLKKIYDTDVAKQTELKIVKDEEGGVPTMSIKLEEGFEINLEDLMKMVGAGSSITDSNEPGPSEIKKELAEV